MPYVISEQVEVLLYVAWYRLEHLMECVHAIRKINFSVVEQRQQALERLNSMQTVIPFSSDLRFLPGLYVCESLGNWPRIFQQLKAALSYKDVTFRKPNKSDEKPQDLYLATQSDAQTAFWNATTSVIDSVKTLDNVYNRSRFEAFYHLIWLTNQQYEDFKRRAEARGVPDPHDVVKMEEHQKEEEEGED